MRIDQVLHGYDRGHRELASSITLDDRARSVMLVLSDLLAETGLRAGASYLVAYPLKSAARHVLARTWAAGPGYRPGSVWTHSLILDYQALALITDLSLLRSLFTGVDSLAQARFYQSIELFLDADGNDRSPGSHSSAAAAVAAIYNDAPQALVEVASDGQGRDEDLALELWSQMWPSLRRDFAFFTGVQEVPSQVGAGCVLAFKDKWRPPPSTEMPQLNLGQRVLLDDLGAVASPLRSYLSRYAVEAKEPRRVAGPLAELWKERSAGPLKVRLGRLNTITAKEPLPRLHRDILAEEFGRTPSIEDLTELITEFRDDEVDIDPSGLFAALGPVRAADLRRLFEVSRSGAPARFGEHCLTSLVAAAPLPALAEAADAAGRALVLELRPDVMDFPAFWPSGDSDRAAILRDLPDVGFGLDRGIKALGASLGPKTLDILLARSARAAAPELLKVFEASAPAARATIGSWLVQDSARFESLVLAQSRLPRELLNSVAHAQIEGGGISIEAATWAGAVEEELASTTSGMANSLLIVSFLCSMALEREPGLRFARLIYDPLQRAVLSRREERFLEAKLPLAARSWPLKYTLARNAVAIWPPTSSGHGALTISYSPENIVDLIHEVERKYGRSALETAILDTNLREPIRLKIIQFLEPPSLKAIRWFWS